MKLKPIVLTFAVISLLTIAGHAQPNERPEPKTIRGGVVNGKAIELVRPPYPAAARAVRASGAVNVEVTIGENGDVIAATAVSGHPLLRAAAVEAARASRFSPTTLSGQPVKVVGIIVYNFLSEMSMIAIGYEMARGEQSAEAAKRLPAAQISGNLPRNWNEISADLGRLSSEVFKIAQPRRPAESVKPASADSNVRPELVSEDKYEVVGAAPEPKIEDLAGFVKETRIKMEKKFEIGDVRSWYFGLGKVLAKIETEIDGADATAINLDELNRHLLTAPLNVSKSVLNDTRTLAASKPNGNTENFKERLRAGIKAIKGSTVAQ